MTPFLLYIGRSSLYLALFYAFFLLVMRRTTFFRLNRILLLVGTVACFLLPLLRLRTVEVPFLMVGPLTEAASEPVLTAGPSASSPFPYLELLYILGFLAVLGWTAVAMARMYRTIRKGAATRLEDGTRLVLTEADVPSFSWGRTIVMSRKDAEQNPVIRLHEDAHIRKAHTLDILLFTAVTLVHWFNPLVWITLSELKLLHEYEADDAVLNHGIDATQYQLLLVRKAVGDKRFTLANGFQHAKLKNRIDMMLQAPSSGWKRLSWLAILPFLAGTMFLCNPVRAKVVSAELAEDRKGRAAVGERKINRVRQVGGKSDEVRHDIQAFDQSLPASAPAEPERQQRQDHVQRVGVHQGGNVKTKATLHQAAEDGPADLREQFPVLRKEHQPADRIQDKGQQQVPQDAEQRIEIPFHHFI